MAMSNQTANPILLFARNGANRPLHQDRQILRAGDLSLEQATQDEMLARARRHLHGWGVVAGLLPEVSAAGLLTIGPGYGVTPLGDEVFLPEPVPLPDAAEAVVLRCGPGPLGCEVIDDRARADALVVAGGTVVDAWLIARPATREAALRPGVPEGCAHPASSLLPSRSCGGVEFEIMCTLPPSHAPKPVDCAALSPFVCGTRGATAPLPWAESFAAASNFLVIARLSVAGRDASGQQTPGRTPPAQPTTGQPVPGRPGSGPTMIGEPVAQRPAPQRTVPQRTEPSAQYPRGRCPNGDLSGSRCPIGRSSRSQSPTVP